MNRTCQKSIPEPHTAASTYQSIRAIISRRTTIFAVSLRGTIGKSDSVCGTAWKARQLYYLGRMMNTRIREFALEVVASVSPKIAVRLLIGGRGVKHGEGNSKPT